MAHQWRVYVNGDAMSELSKSKQEGLFSKVKTLVEEGHGRVYISKELGISDSKATRVIKKLRQSGGVKEAKKETLSEKVKKQVDSGKDLYDIAKEVKKTPRQVKAIVKQSDGSSSPVHEWLYKLAKRGILLSKLTKETGITSLHKAEIVLQETFEGCFIATTPVANEDFLLVPIKDSRNVLRKYDIDDSKRPFKVGIVSHNYIVVKVNDDLPTNKLTFFDLTDIHVGSKKFRKQEFINVMSLINKDPGALVLLGGDDIEVITKFSVADPMEQYESINDQVTEFLELIKI